MKVWGAIAAGLVRRDGAVLISIRDALGSTPREAGTRMVVFGDGTFTGTIGGGTLEWRAIAEAQRMLAGSISAAPERFASPPSPTRGEEGIPGGDLVQSSPRPLGGRDRGRGSQTEQDIALLTHFHDRAYALGPELGQCCGGRVTLRFEAISPGAIDQIRRLAEREAEGTFEVVAETTDSLIARRIISDTVTEDPNPRDIEHHGEHARSLLLFGAGHVGRALVLALAALPFRIIWVDARPDAFPGAVPANVTLVRPADPVAVIASADAGSFVLIMTHSHELDLALCDAALRTGRLPYVGVIGSATKRARFERRLEAAGIARKAIDQLVCPIGAVGPKSKLPAVIAAATAVELLVKDEMCLKVEAGLGADQTLETIAAHVPTVKAMARGRSSGS